MKKAKLQQASKHLLQHATLLQAEADRMEVVGLDPTKAYEKVEEVAAIAEELLEEAKEEEIKK